MRDSFGNTIENSRLYYYVHLVYCISKHKKNPKQTKPPATPIEREINT